MRPVIGRLTKMSNHPAAMLDNPLPETKQMSDIPILKDKAQHVPADFRGTSREGPTAFARNTPSLYSAGR